MLHGKPQKSSKKKAENQHRENFFNGKRNGFTKTTPFTTPKVDSNNFSYSYDKSNKSLGRGISIADAVIAKINTDALKFSAGKFGCFRQKGSQQSNVRDRSCEIPKESVRGSDRTPENENLCGARKGKEDRRVVLGVEVSRLNRKISSHRSRRENSKSSSKGGHFYRHKDSSSKLDNNSSTNLHQTGPDAPRIHPNSFMSK
jgi:hypothetical protein